MTEEDLDSEALVFRHIDRIMRSASLDLEDMGDRSHNPTMDVNTWSHRVMFACEFFHAFLKPSMSEEEFKEIKDYAKQESGEFKDSPFNKIEFGRHLFRKDVQHLHKNNMIFQESDDLVIEDKSDEKLEPESSEVSEEVIE